MLRFSVMRPACRRCVSCEKFEALGLKVVGKPISLKGDKTRYVLFSPELWADFTILARGVLEPRLATKSGVTLHLSNVVVTQRQRCGRAFRRRYLPTGSVMPTCLSASALEGCTPPHFVQATLGHSSSSHNRSVIPCSTAG